MSKQVKKIIEGVERIGWGTTTCLCFVGSTIAVMRHLGEKVTNEYAMGISGGAFKMFWEMPWGPANCDLLIIGDEPVRRTFDALGYGFTFVHKLAPIHTKEEFRKMVVDSIDRGRPIIAEGIVGPPECCVVTGYDEGGAILHGWSYFQEDQSYFIKDDWYKDCDGLILIGEKKPKPSQREVLINTLVWAIKLAREPEFVWGFPRIRRTKSGLMAFDAMAEQLLWDDIYEFSASNLDALSMRTVPITNDGILIMQCKRAYARDFTKSMANEGLPGSNELHKASEEYSQEEKVWGRAVEMAPGWGSVLKEKLANKAHRSELSRLVRKARVHEERAVGHLEDALSELVT